MSSRKDKILLIGPIPEPRGGVGVHILRLSDLLQNRYSITYIDESPVIKKGIYNIRSKNLPYYIKLIRSSDVIHVHSGVLLLRVFHILVSKLLLRKKTIVTIHSLSRKTALNIWINRIILRLPDKVITVNPMIRDLLGLTDAIVKPAFIPPNMQTEPVLPASVVAWSRLQRQKGRKILCANASRLGLYEGVDLYGADLCINSMRALIYEYHRPVSLIFIVASLARCEELYRKYQQQIFKSGLKEYIMLAHTKLSFAKLIDSSDIVLRPTNTDGDALTIREALFLDRPVIASDVVPRPAGTKLFSTRSTADLTRAVIAVLDNEVSSQRPEDRTEAYSDFYMNVYA